MKGFGQTHGRSHRVPGFGISLGLAVTYASLVILLPLAVLALRGASLGPSKLIALAFDARARSAYALTFGAAAIATLVNATLGVIVAWSLTRYRFPGRGIVDALIDLPLALPTAVSGIALAGVYGQRGVLGSILARAGIDGAYSRLGVVLALVFVGLPFVVRSVEPMIAELSVEEEEAAASLGASRFTTFRRVILPALGPAILTGAALSFARALGEYGSVVFISGNMPYKTEIASLLIMTRLEQYDYDGATAIATVMLTASFALLFLVSRLEGWSGRRVSA